MITVYEKLKSGPLLNGDGPLVDPYEVPPMCSSTETTSAVFKKGNNERWEEYYRSDPCKPERAILLQTPFICSDLGRPGTDSHHIKYMWHSLTHFSRKLWIWSFGCSYLTPGKASHKYFPCSFKPSNAWFSPLILKQCIHFQLGRMYLLEPRKVNA